MVLAVTEIPGSHRDLLQSAVATLATIGPDGRPQLTEVWFLEDEGSVAISLNTSRQKTKNLADRPQCSLLVLDLAVPQRYLEIRGDAESAPTTTSFLPRRSARSMGWIFASTTDPATGASSYASARTE
jgi:PPOX class probable F420-dependent enzyme